MIRKLIVVLLFLFVLTNCGGGGGGDGATGSGDRFGVRVLHGGLEISPVEYADPDDETQLLSSQFLQSSLYKSFPEGQQTLSFFRRNSGGSRFVTSLTFSVEKETRYSVLLFGDQTELGPRTVVFTDATPELSGGEAAVRFIHSVDEASAIQIGDTAIPFGGLIGYETVTAGEFSFAVSRQADGLLLTSGTLTLEEGNAYTILVAGQAGIFVGVELVQDS